MTLDCRDATDYSSEMLDPRFHEALKATEPNKLRQMPTEKVIEYEQYFAEQIPQFGLDAKHQQYRKQCHARMDSLRREIQHREAFGLGTKTLFWARLAVVAAVVVPVALALISQLPFSKLLPARIDKASPPTYLQTPAPTAASPVQEASSNTATPSPEQAMTAQPTAEFQGSKPSP